jgi:hypothetical protein
MNWQRAPAVTPTGSAIAERLLAHARLCEEVARACWNEETAQTLQRMAGDCASVAARITCEYTRKAANHH